MPSTITIEFSTESGIANLNLDPVHIDQVISNLCINAKDAIEGSGTIAIDIHTRQLIELHCASCKGPVNGEFVVLSIADSGTGMEDELLGSIFTPLFTTKAEDKGTGMGLAIIHNIMHHYSGHILVSSQPGKGTTFKLLFPIFD